MNYFIGLGFLSELGDCSLSLSLSLSLSQFVNNIYKPISHVSPVRPGGQIHWDPFKRSWQVPPPLQAWESQLFSITERISHLIIIFQTRSKKA